VTRFIGLAPVGNAAKQKSLHALGLQPATHMDIATLQQKPAGSTPCPYNTQKRSLEDNLQDQVPPPSWRVWMATSLCHTRTLASTVLFCGAHMSVGLSQHRG